MLVKNTNTGEGIALAEPTLLSVFFNFRIAVFPAKWIEMGFVLPNVFGRAERFRHVLVKNTNTGAD